MFASMAFGLFGCGPGDGTSSATSDGGTAATSDAATDGGTDVPTDLPTDTPPTGTGLDLTPSVTENTMTWDGAVFQRQTDVCFAAPDLLFNGQFVGEGDALINLVMQFIGLGEPATGAYESAVISARPYSGGLQVHFVEGDQVAVINDGDGTWQFVWNERSFAPFGGEPVVSSGWFHCTVE